MISWGIVAAMTAFVKVPWHFYTVRFFLGLAEAGFFPGVIVYLTHWFPSRDRARALSWFLIATPIAQITSPKLSNELLKIGIDGHPRVLGMVGWQWVYIAWGIPAVVLGVLVLLFLTDRPGQANWLAPDERDALELELKREKALRHGSRHMTLGEAFRHPKVLLLAAAYFFIVTGNYGVEFFLPSILEKWYRLKLDKLTWMVIIPPVGSLLGQLFVGWSSDRTGERRLHAAMPIYMGAVALIGTLLIRDQLWVTVALFTVALTGLKAYLPAFWSLPSLFLTEAAAAGSIGLINSVGNLGGFLGPSVIGTVEKLTGSFQGGITFLALSMAISATILVTLGLGHRVEHPPALEVVLDESDAVIEPI
jgi:ACS family tartrate transporter-like MFS transporter